MTKLWIRAPYQMITFTSWACATFISLTDASHTTSTTFVCSISITSLKVGIRASRELQDPLTLLRLRQPKTLQRLNGFVWIWLHFLYLFNLYFTRRINWEKNLLYNYDLARRTNKRKTRKNRKKSLEQYTLSHDKHKFLNDNSDIITACADIEQGVRDQQVQKSARACWLQSILSIKMFKPPHYKYSNSHTLCSCKHSFYILKKIFPWKGVGWSCVYWECK